MTKDEAQHSRWTFYEAVRIVTDDADGERLGQLVALGSPEGQTERFSRKEVG